MTGVPWRRAVMVFAALAVALSGVFVALRADGFDAVDATVPRATRWFVDRDLQVLVLADGFAGQALAKIQLETDSRELEVVQSPSGAVVLDRSTNATSQTIDTAALRVGSAQTLSLVAAPDAVAGVGQSGVVAVAPGDPEGVLLPPEGDSLRFPVGAIGPDDATRISPDGAVWTIAEGSFTRITTIGREVFETGLGTARFTLVGNTSLLLDADRSRVRFGTGAWQSLPDDVPASEIVVQQPGPTESCGWIGANDDLWCVGAEGFVEHETIDGLDIDGSDLLAIAGDAGVLVRTASPEIVRLDWRAGLLFDDPDDSQATPRPDASFTVASSVDLVWVEDTASADVWAINPWGVQSILKTDEAPVLAETGELIDAGEGGSTTGSAGIGELVEPIERTPDGDGIDDPPEAYPDQVTARFGISVSIAVTANDFDPDGEAIAVVGVTQGENGLVTISSASTVLYAPEPGTVGLDRFEYTIADGSGTEATATVTVQLLPADAPNTAPIGTPDESQTGLDIPVVVDVLANDVDPERDALQIGSFTGDDVGGTVTLSEGPTGQPALEYTPPPNVSGTATFEYRPVDAFGALGRSVEVVVEIAQRSDGNRPPIARPDALRVRRNAESRVNVLANDSDPDNDRLALTVSPGLPNGLDVRVDGDELVIVVRAGADSLLPFNYAIDDGTNDPVIGYVLVSIIDDAEPNSPPLANADTDSAVVGIPKLIDVLANDTDPDNDRPVLLSVAPALDGSTIGDIRVRGNRVEYVVDRLASDEAVFDRFTYEITDGRGNEAIGEVTVRVLPEEIDVPPFARDDSATTMIDVPVTLDVLRNDGDPSGAPLVLRPQIGCPSGGEAIVTESRVQYTPPRGRSGVFICTYEIGNSQGLSAFGEIVVTVVAPSVTNVLPIVPFKEQRVAVGESLVISLLDGVTDPDAAPGDAPLEVIASSAPNAGLADRTGNTLTYAAPDAPAVDAIDYQVRDAAGGVTTGLLQIVAFVPDPVPPEANDDLASVTNDRSGITVGISVLTNDRDPDIEDGDEPIRVTDADVLGDGGTASFTPDSVTVALADRFYGRVRVAYEITDAQGLTDTAEILIDSVEPANRRPTLTDDEGVVANGGSVGIAISLNDFDPDADVLVYSLVSGASSAYGQAEIQNGNTLVFAAAPGASGTAIVVYSATDGEFTESAVVRITVQPCSASLPEAPDLNLVTGYQQPIFVDLTTVAGNGEIIEVGAPLGAASGVYTPPAGFNDNVTFSYVVRNSCRVEATGRVTIDVNQDPSGTAVATDMGRTATLNVPVESLASDPNQELLVISALEGQPTWVTVTPDNRGFTAAPAGATGLAQFTAVVSDPGGLFTRVPVSINLVNLPPVPVADQYRADDGAIVMSVLSNDGDPDGDTVTLQSVPATVTFTNGVTVALVQTSNNRIRVDPGAGVGTATFDYGIIDSQNLPSVQMARVTITVNTPPTAPPVDVTMPPDSETTVTVPATDPDGGPLVLTIESDPSPLMIVVNGLDLTITAPPEAQGNTYALIYQVIDPLGASTEGTLNVTVEPAAPG